MYCFTRLLFLPNLLYSTYMSLHGTTVILFTDNQKFRCVMCKMILHRQPIVYFRVASLFSCMFVYFFNYLSCMYFRVSKYTIHDTDTRYTSCIES